MTDVLTTRTEIPAEVDAFYDRALLERAVPLLVHTSFAQVRDIPQNSGTDTIRFRKYGALTAQTTALVDGVTPTGKQLSVTDVTAQVLYYGDYVVVTDKVLYETFDPLLTETAQILGEQAGDSIDQLCRNIMAACTTHQHASTATVITEITSAMKLTRAEVKEAVRTLKGNNARPITSRIDPNTGYNTTPLAACYVGIVHPNTVYDLDDAIGWIPVEKYPNKADVMPGEVGSLAGVRFIESTNAKSTASAGAGSITVYNTIILGANAYGITRLSGVSLQNIVKPLGSGDDPLNQRATSGWKASFIAKILNQDFMIRIEHAVSS